ncbi:hypothetical protein K2173_018624 [Erythroxylum novogranatense]|uniref:Myb-like protein X n=1 Tax=Erythroxylum novogranatense TaxID=1862640 RepID=A0AAV8SAG1_9ROSI|nr:hypothetical protein K2173_018624 [Erythroxylum novogranatense]
MSRCFPFPPPGYEKKATIDDTDLLAKEKLKEKKHKKDRKEKEKKEAKEKKEKDRSKEKHKEKKDRKEKHKDKDKDRDKEKKQVSDEKRFEGQPEFHNGRKFSFNSLPDKEINDSECVQELAKRIREEDGASGSQMVQKIAAPEQQSPEVQRKAVDNPAYYQNEEQQKIKDKNEDCKKVNGKRNLDARGMEKRFGPSFPGGGPARIEGITKLVDKNDTEKAIEGKEKSKHKEHNDKGDKYKLRDHEKDQKSKNNEREKEKKKKEKKKEVNESTKDQPKLKIQSPQLKESSKDSLDFRIPQFSDAARLDSMNSHVEGNFGKRKEVEINGYVPGNGDRPNKLARQILFSNLVIENGRKLEPCQSAIQCASEKQVLADNHGVDVKEHKINGSIASLQPIVCKPRQCSATIPAKENGEAYKKPPHPDLNYLKQILSVPTMDEWPDSCDQEWLFSTNVKSTKIEDSSLTKTSQVWAEPQHIESADIVALPYVIPY